MKSLRYELKEGESGKITFEDEVDSRKATRTEFEAGKLKVLVALELAIELACHNIPELEGRVAILTDHSGSMRGDGGGASLVSALSKTTSSDIANIFSAMLLSKQPSV